MSKGIHELKEEECLQYFDIVKTGIELILDERVEQRVREEKMKEATQSISRLRGEL